MPQKNELPVILTQTRVAEWISQGMTRQYCITKLQEEGITRANADHIYYGALKDILPDPDLFADYKKTLTQQNIDRLEAIVASSLSGNTAEKAIAIKAIDTLNKMTGAYGDGNTVTIGQKDGEQVIRISFD